MEWALEMLVGTVPASKLLYGSDEAGEPEAFWASGLLARSRSGGCSEASSMATT